jgi:topoisomerase-4 subunit A
VVYSPKVTEWSSSYDGRNKEPVTLPVKFPLLLAQGVEGIAVGLSCRILPHNFIELCDASVATLRGEPFKLLPDFATGGFMDATDYNDGQRGGRVRVRAKIEQGQKKNTLVITQIPFGTTTGGLQDSIVAANDKGKIKIARVDDNTAEFVEMVIQLPGGADPDQTIQALYRLYRLRNQPLAECGGDLRRQAALCGCDGASEIQRRACEETARNGAGDSIG